MFEKSQRRSELVALKVTPTEKDQLQHEAAKRDITVSELLRLGLDCLLGTPEETAHGAQN